jgi:hypothetical protein
MHRWSVCQYKLERNVFFPKAKFCFLYHLNMYEAALTASPGLQLRVLFDLVLAFSLSTATLPPYPSPGHLGSEDLVHTFLHAETGTSTVTAAYTM